MKFRIRTLPVLACVAMLLPATFSLVAASPPCDEATKALEAELEASNNQLTPSVARAFKAAVEACPNGQATTPSNLLSTPTNVPMEPKPHVKFDVRVLPQACGFTTAMTGHHDDAPLSAYRMLILRSDVTNEYGPADVTYNPATDVASYTVRGPTYGMTATGPAGLAGGASGYIFVYGIPIPTTYASVNTGCDVNNPTLCWGYGHAETKVNGTGLTVGVLSAFNHC